MNTNNLSVEPSLIKVFYDGQCPLCRREIRHYQRMRGADEIHWIDVTDDDAEIHTYGLSLDRALARFHVLDTRGNWQTGAYGFATLWNQLPAMRWLASVLRVLHLLPLADYFYAVFARLRLGRRCDQQVCDRQQGHSGSTAKSMKLAPAKEGKR